MHVRPSFAKYSRRIADGQADAHGGRTRTGQRVWENHDNALETCGWKGVLQAQDKMGAAAKTLGRAAQT